MSLPYSLIGLYTVLMLLTLMVVISSIFAYAVVVVFSQRISTWIINNILWRGYDIDNPPPRWRRNASIYLNVIVRKHTYDEGKEIIEALDKRSSDKNE